MHIVLSDGALKDSSINKRRNIMLKKIKINYEPVEMMLFYWESVASKEKVVDSYFIEVANKDEMQVLYKEGFAPDSVRKVLSAIVNRELMNSPTKLESKFWNANMWMLEDLGNMRSMLKPIKLLNLDDLMKEFASESKYEELVVNFIPGTDETFYKEGNVLTVNFFRLMVDMADPEVVKVEGQDFKEFMLEKAREVLK